MASSSRLKPDEKGKINISVDTKDKVGPLTRIIQVRTSDPKNPVITLSVRLVVKKTDP
jgi:hypothetical protein